MNSIKLACITGVMFGIISTTALADGWDPTSAATNMGGISNTRHNMTQSYLANTNAGIGIGFMNAYRNNYGEVCVYCHTPHGASQNMGSAPLWNRTKPSGTFATYNQLNTSTLTRPVTQPGANSLTCLSCHDGVTAIDSVINMPGSGRYNENQAVATNTGFLDAWPSAAGQHASMSGCGYCHDAAGPSGFGAPDFTIFTIGQDLKNDHPVGVLYPTTFVSGGDFNQPTVTTGDLRFFEKNNNNRADTNEIRLYQTGEGYEVECASCHDPHGVPSAGVGSKFIPSFLRVANNNSGLCLTCHVK